MFASYISSRTVTKTVSVFSTVFELT